MQVYNYSSTKFELVKEIRTKSDIKAIQLLDDNFIACAQNFGWFDIVDLNTNETKLKTSIPSAGIFFDIVQSKQDKNKLLLGCTNGLIELTLGPALQITNQS